MRKIITILILSLYSLGNILLPNGEMTNLHDMYTQCAAEDPDINAADFVFEHLLNLPDVFAFLEKDDEREQPHQPLQHTVSVTQIVVAITKPIVLECRPVFYKEQIVKYPLRNSICFPTGHLSEIFRPPIV